MDDEGDNWNNNNCDDDNYNNNISNIMNNNNHWKLNKWQHFCKFLHPRPLIQFNLNVTIYTQWYTCVML